MYLIHQSSWYLNEVDLGETFFLQKIINYYYDFTFYKIIELYKIVTLLVLNKIL
jgi:hypothetical protein